MGPHLDLSHKKHKRSLATKSHENTKLLFVPLVADLNMSAVTGKFVTDSMWRRALSPTGNTGDAVFRILMLLVALLMVGIVVAMVVALAAEAMPSIRQFGFSFLRGQAWNPIKGDFGALPFIYGTVASSLIALLISVPFSLGIAIFLVEQAPHYIARPVGFLV